MSGRNSYNVVFKRLYYFKSLFNYTNKAKSLQAANETANEKAIDNSALNLLSTKNSNKRNKKTQELSLQIRSDTRKQIAKILSKSSTTIKLSHETFVNDYFLDVLGDLNSLTVVPNSVNFAQLQNKSNDKYKSLSINQFNKLIKSTKSQAELLSIFDNLMGSSRLTRTSLINILLNKSLDDQVLINNILFRVMQSTNSISQPAKDNANTSGIKDLKSEGIKLNNWNKIDFICLQVAITQKFFSLKKFDDVNYLVSLNFESSWLPAILSQDRVKQKPNEVLPEFIERSIWRVFFLFIKDFEMLNLLIRDDKLAPSSLILLLEAIPKNLFIELENGQKSIHKHQNQFFEVLFTKLSSLNSLSDYQELFVKILNFQIIRKTSDYINDLKLISIKTNLALSTVLNSRLANNLSHYSNERKTLNLSNSISRALLSTIDEKRQSTAADDLRMIDRVNSTGNNGTGVSSMPELPLEKLKLKKINTLLIIEISQFMKKVKQDLESESCNVQEKESAITEVNQIQALFQEFLDREAAQLPQNTTDTTGVGFSFLNALKIV